MNVQEFIGLPLEIAKKRIGNASYEVIITGDMLHGGTLVVTNAKKQEEIVVFTCSWFILNLGG